MSAERAAVVAVGVTLMLVGLGLLVSGRKVSGVSGKRWPAGRAEGPTPLSAGRLVPP